jgi:hypothetical protein
MKPYYNKSAKSITKDEISGLYGYKWRVREEGACH